MFKGFKLDIKNALSFVEEGEYTEYLKKAEEARTALVRGEGPGRELTGWVDLPHITDREQLDRIMSLADKVRKDSEVLIVIGIGGSSLGSRAAISFLSGTADDGHRTKGGGPRILFAGNDLSGTSAKAIAESIGDADFSLAVISKSGTTLEPALSFRVFKKLLEDRYGKDDAAKRIYCITEDNDKALHRKALKEGYHLLYVPKEIGGRYSVLSPAGLFPVAVAGGDIEELIKGAEEERINCLDLDPDKDPALMYAALRQLLYHKGRKLEMFSSFEPCIMCLGEWWKQLYGESEGKGGKGIFPVTAMLSRDLHSIGQYIQDGERILFETILGVENTASDMVIPETEDDFDGNEYLAGKLYSDINRTARQATIAAHVKGDVPCMEIILEDQTEHTLGRLIYFYEFACGISGYIQGINPFDQPGVDEYKKNIYERLRDI